VLVLQAGTEGGCVVLFDITSDGIVYNRSFANLDGKHILIVLPCMIDDHDECSGWMFLLVPAHPGCPGQIPQSRKTVVCVCVTMQRYANVVYAVVMCLFLSVCLSVCLSATHWYCIKMAKLKITQQMPHDSPGTLVFWRRRFRQNSNGFIPNWDAKCIWGRFTVGDVPQITGYNLKTVQDRCIVSIKVK